ncbi:MAG: alpha-hydroxy-acid oxidizing enzyme, partial [Actinobacteria bacterium]|nr:alpha-hydroxy-acid oxidizing enzyme [Actinomycetota bacterium]
MNQNIKRTFPSPSALSELLKFKKFEFNGRTRRLARANTVWDLRNIAKARTPKGPFDYTDGGAELEISLNRSREVFSNIEFAPKILQDVSNISTQAKVLG